MRAPKRVLFRADASERMGTGHVVRCLTLADRLRKCGAEVHFVSRLLEGHLCDLVEARGFIVHRLLKPSVAIEKELPKYAACLGVSWEEDAKQTISVIANNGHFDWVCVDHYALDHRWETNARAIGNKVMVIDDLADRVHDCDLLLDQNLVAEMETRYEGLVPPETTLLLGPEYALLNDDYARLRPRAAARDGNVRRLLVSFGGFDQDGLTEMTVRALCDLYMFPFEADIILASSSPQFAQIAALVEDLPQLRLHDRVPGLARLILAADLAVGAGGTTHWERLALGLPALVITVAENQRQIAEELARRGLIHWLGDADQIDLSMLRTVLSDVLSKTLDIEWSERCLALVDGRGANRVGAALLAGPDIELTLRHATLDDEALLLDWANNPQTRKNAFDPRPITSGEHRSWFRTRLRRPDDCLLWIAETEFGVPIGQIRFDRRGPSFEISYALAPDFRGRGVGKVMLKMAIVAFKAAIPSASLFGQVKVDNSASSRIFEQLGFSVRDGGPDRLIFELGS